MFRNRFYHYRFRQIKFWTKFHPNFLGQISIQGPMLWFFKDFRRKNWQKNRVSTQNKTKLCKMLIITPFLPPKIVKNCRKLWS
jgi:hypothetical protein